MSRYIIKRVISAIITLFLVATLTFFLMYLVPGGPFLAEKAPSPQTMKALEEKYGLDQPVGVQYTNYMKRLLKGDLGTSLKMRGQEVNHIIKTRFPISAKLGLCAVILAVSVGLPIGSFAALKRGKFLDRLIMFFSTLGMAVPGFVVATVLMYFFGVKLRVLPTFGLTSPLHYILPVIALAFYPTAYISRLMRSSMLDIIGQDYMRTAKAKGVSQFKSLFKHALRNAILPVVTYLGPMLASILTGSFIVEKVFTIPGLGNQFIGSITDRDYPLIMGTTIFLAFLLITMNVLVDIAYKIIDPRIKME
ncbi:MAG: ABC transporter permease [Clostridiaceae bacterium]|jgi:oligopeptide transport system permease protein|nr:ABC transporter permease [Clostridiaceae bacterium]